MSSLTPLVPEKTYAVCTNGLQTGEMVVHSQDNTKSKVTKLNKNLIANINDKPTNFKCVYLGVLTAIIGGAIVALCASGAGAVIAGVLIATLAGVIAAYGFGAAICSWCLSKSEWIGYHPKVLVEGQPAVIGTSTIVCNVPIFPSGFIRLYYSKEVADRVASIYRTRNLFKILDGAVLGFVSVKLIGSIIGSFTANSIFVASYQTGKTLILGKAFGDVLVMGQHRVGQFGADQITPVSNDESRYANKVSDPKFSDVYAEGSKSTTEQGIDWVMGNKPNPSNNEGAYDITKGTLGGTDPTGVIQDIATANSGGAIANEMGKAEANHKTTAGKIEQEYGTKESVMKENNKVATAGKDGVTARANQYRKDGMSRSDAFKRAWAEYKAANEAYANERMAQKAEAHAKNDAALRDAKAKQEAQLKNKENAKTSLAVLGLSFFGGTLGELIASTQTNNFKKDLPDLQDKEAEAIAKVGIFEELI